MTAIRTRVSPRQSPNSIWKVETRFLPVKELDTDRTDATEVRSVFSGVNPCPKLFDYFVTGSFTSINVPCPTALSRCSCAPNARARSSIFCKPCPV